MERRLREIFEGSIRFIRYNDNSLFYVRLRGCYPKEQIENMIKEFEDYATSYTWYDNDEEMVDDSYFYYEPTNYTQFCLFQKKVFNEKKKVLKEISNERLYKIVGGLRDSVDGKLKYYRVLIKPFRDYWNEICNMKYLLYLIE